MKSVKLLSNIFKEDLKQYHFILDNYEILSSEDGATAYKLAQMSIIQADRWSEISLNASKLGRDNNIAKTDLYNWAYHKYRILMTIHEHCRVVYRQCAEAERCRWNEN